MGILRSLGWRPVGPPSARRYIDPEGREHSYREARNIQAHARGFPSLYAQQHAPRSITTADAYERLSPRQQATYQKVVEALGLKRYGQREKQAARNTGTTVRMMRKYGAVAYERRDGHWHVMDHDNFSDPCAYIRPKAPRPY
jgi:hypothetical protein